MAREFIAHDTDTHLPADPAVLAALDIHNDGRYSPRGTAAVTRQRYDAGGEALASKLELGAGGDIVMCLLGDSTGNDGNEWFKLWVNEIAAARPAMRVEYSLWSDGDQAYPSMTVVQAGTDYVAPGMRTTVSDSFSRTASEASGTTPETGSAWSGSTGGWSLNGSQLVAGATGPDLSSSGGLAGDSAALLTGVTLNTTGSGTAKQIRLYTKYVSASNHVYVYVNISTTGNVSWGVFKRINGTATSIVTGSALGLAANASNTFNMAISVTGLNLSATVNGVTGTATLTQSDADTLAGATSMAIGTGGNTSTAGLTIESASMQVNAAASGQKLTVYNGSMPGSTLAYQSSRLSTMVPVRPDLVLLSSGHNYTSGLPGPYLAAFTQLVADLRSLYSGVAVTVSSQNPEFSPWPSGKAHLDRLAQLRILALQNGWGYLPVLEAFRAKSDGGQSLVMSDGIHPTSDGSILWRSVASTYLAAKMLTPA